MSAPSTTLAAARTWCLKGRSEQAVDSSDDTLTILSAESLSAELDAATRQYYQAVAEGADTVYFVVRDRRAPRERIVAGLRERGVPLSQVPGVEPKNDPVAMELLRVTTALLESETNGEVSGGIRDALASRVDLGIDIDNVLTEVTAAPTLVAALDRWITTTNLVDRLLRAENGVHPHGHPRGTISQSVSADHLMEIREAAHSIDTLRQAGISLPDVGINALVSVIEDSMMDHQHPLLMSQSIKQYNPAEVELVEMAELKISDSADVVIILEATERLFDDNPNDRLFMLDPVVGEHPDTPGVTAVTVDRAERMFGSLPHTSDGIHAWFVGLGRRYVGNALAAARTRAVICTRQGTDTSPSRTVIELQEQLDLPMESVGDDEDWVADDAVQTRIEQLQRHLDAGDDSIAGDDATDVAEQLRMDIRDGGPSKGQLGTVIQLLAHNRTTTESPDGST